MQKATISNNTSLKQNEFLRKNVPTMTSLYTTFLQKNTALDNPNKDVSRRENFYSEMARPTVDFLGNYKAILAPSQTITGRLYFLK